MMRFAGQCAFITGGARGMGRTFGQAFAAEGASIAVVDVDVETAKATASDLEASGAQALAIGCDITDETEVADAVASVVDRFGGIDILVNNAGLHLLKYNQPFGVLPRDDLRALFEVNVFGIVTCSVACRESMRTRGGGVIVNISSVAGHMSTTPYGVSKLAVRGLTVALATEFAPDAIRVNAISPGLIVTDNLVSDLGEEAIERVRSMQLVKHAGTPEHISDALLFLCSDEARMITGETLKVTGGGWALNI